LAIENELLEKRRKSEWIAKEVVLREYLNSEMAKALAETEADEERRTAMINAMDDDGTVIESREGIEDEEMGHGEIPPYPYAPEEHQRETIIGLA